jgi:hypothetical protein
MNRFGRLSQRAALPWSWPYAAARFLPIVWGGLALVWGTLGGSAACAVAQQLPDPSKLEQLAGDAVGETVWYDPDSDRLKPMTLETQSDDSIHRDSRWSSRPQKASQQNSGFWESLFGSLRGFFASLGGAFSSATLFAWLILILLIGLLVALLVYAYSRIDQQPDLVASKGRKGGGPLDAAARAERMEQLPEALQDQPHDLRGAAALAREQGQLERAIIFLFGHQLLLLDQHQLLRLSRGKTNRQYLREAAVEPLAGEVLGGTVESFEASYFGRHPLSRERFETLWTENARLESALSEQHEAVA